MVLKTQQKYEQRVRLLLKNGESPREVCAMIYNLFQEYAIDEDLVDYLYGVADPTNALDTMDGYYGPADDWLHGDRSFDELMDEHWPSPVIPI